MTLSSEMTRLAADLEASQADRLAAVAAIAPAVQSDLERGRAALNSTMKELMSTIDADLKGIFSQAAITRGRARDLIDRFTGERKDSAERLRTKLGDHMSNLESSVQTLLNEYATARSVMGGREADARARYLEDLRTRVNAQLAEAGKFVDALAKDREGAGRAWHLHTRNMEKMRRGGYSKSDSPTAKSTAPKKKVAVPEPAKEVAAKPDTATVAPAPTVPNADKDRN